jgi:hypothetical protein
LQDYRAFKYVFPLDIPGELAMPLLDLDFRSKHDSFLSKMKVIEELGPGLRVVYCKSNLVRDYLIFLIVD